MQVVILAGGKGTRLGPVSKRLPKPMIPLAGKPLLEHQIEVVRRYGFKDVILLTGHLGDVIERHLGDGSKWGVRVRCHRESSPLGTAGALKEIESWLDEDFLVLYGDILMDVDLRPLVAFHKAKQPLATLAVHPNSHPYDSDLLELGADGEVVAFHAKPHPDDRYFHNLVNAAIYVLSPNLLSHIAAKQPADLGRDVFPRLVQSGKQLYGYNTSEYIMDVGTIERLQKAEADLASGKVGRLNRVHQRRAIFLDRDGVLNVEVDHVRSPEQLVLIPGAAQAVRQINESGRLAVLVSNQPAVAKGFVSEAEVDRIHAKLETLLGAEGAYLDRIYYCPHHPQRGHVGERAEYKRECECRKPAPGMLLTAAVELNVDLPGSFMLGDRTADIEAGRAAGCRTILVRTGYAGSDGRYDGPPDFVCDDLAQAVQVVLSETDEALAFDGVAACAVGADTRA